jgi:hypothetical protein
VGAVRGQQLHALPQRTPAVVQECRLLLQVALRMRLLLLICLLCV